MAIDMGRISIRLTVFRIVESDPPTLRDFQSYKAQGKPRPSNLPWTTPDPYEGVSAYATFERARRVARRRPSFGTFIARLEIRDGAPVTWVGPGKQGHYDLCADPHVLMACVADVSPV